MKNKELFTKTVNILVDAYFKNTLQHGNCAACAVGNIIACNMGIKFRISAVCDGFYTWDGLKVSWNKVFVTPFNHQQHNEFNYEGEAKEQIDSTGYTWQELAKVEFAFETAYEGKSEDDYMFNGLMSVVDVLIEIHEGNETEKETAKELFVLN